MAPRRLTAAEAVARACKRATRKAVGHLEDVLSQPDDPEALEMTRKDKIAREFLRGYQAQQRAQLNANRPVAQINAVIVPATAGSIEEWQARRQARLEAEKKAIDAVVVEPISPEPKE